MLVTNGNIKNIVVSDLLLSGIILHYMSILWLYK